MRPGSACTAPVLPAGQGRAVPRRWAALAAAALCLPLAVVLNAAPGSSAGAAPPPILVESLTPVRSTFPDDLSIRIKIKDEHGNRSVRLEDPSRVAVARITVQPGAKFPMHTHPGPVIVSVVEGQLTYLDAATCHERVYLAGTAFVDTGGDVHSAIGGPMGAVLVATFLGAPVTGPLTLPVADQTACT